MGEGQDKEISAAIIASSGTILAAVATIVISQNRAKKREIAKHNVPIKYRLTNNSFL
jgi:hypothetical protein